MRGNRRGSSIRIAGAVAVISAVLAGCGGGAPSADEWRSQVISICNKLIDERNAGTVGFTQDPPPIDQLRAFYAVFAPQFAEAASEIEALEQPNGLAAQIDELFTSLDAAVAAIEKSSTDEAALQAEISGSDPEHDKIFTRLEAATNAAGLSPCNG